MTSLLNEALREWLAVQPGIVGIHCLTSANALHYAYQTSSNDDTRKLALLQAVSFLPLFRQAMLGRGKLADLRIDALEKTDAKKGIDDVFVEAGKDRLTAARKALTLLVEQPSRAEEMMATARRLIFAKGRDSHDYKYSSAVLEDYYTVSPKYRPNFLAAAMFQLRNAGEKDNDLIQRTRNALAKG